MQSSPTKEFERAVLAEMAVLYRVARRLGASVEQSEDLVQVTMLKACKNWHQFDGKYLRSWLVRILRNERHAELRGKSSIAEWEELTEDTVVEQPFWSTVENNIGAELILRALDALPESFRMCVQLCDVEQMSYEEAAFALGVPIGTVRSRLFRGRAELRKKLGGLM